MKPGVNRYYSIYMIGIHRVAVDHRSRIPPYMQIRDHLLGQVRCGVLSGRLPGERRLADAFGVAYMTTRRAIGELVDAGILIREQGRGTFVSPSIQEQP